MTDKLTPAHVAAMLKAMIAAYNPGRTVTILDTEWGAHSIPRPSAGKGASLQPDSEVQSSALRPF